MGYTTDFTGCVRIEPPLNSTEAEYLTAFNRTRRMSYAAGPYCVDESSPLAEVDTPSGGNTTPPEGQPGLWCQWVPCEGVTDAGRVHPAAALEWDGGEKFYESAEWMKYLIDHFLKPGAAAEGQPGFEEFTFDHVCNGVIWAQGEDPDDKWKLIVDNNVVKTAAAIIAWAEPEDVA